MLPLPPFEQVLADPRPTYRNRDMTQHNPPRAADHIYDVPAVPVIQNIPDPRPTFRRRIPIPQQEPYRSIIDDEEVMEGVREGLGDMPQGQVAVAPPDDTLRPVVLNARGVDQAAAVMGPDRRVNARTVVVRFRYRAYIHPGNNRNLDVWRTARVYMDAPRADIMQQLYNNQGTTLMDLLAENIWGTYAATPDILAAISAGPEPDGMQFNDPQNATGNNQNIRIDSVSFVKDMQDLVRIMANNVGRGTINRQMQRNQNEYDAYRQPSRQQAIRTSAGRRMFGVQDPHRSFRYMIEGCDLKNLNPIVPETWCHKDEDCDNMCAYRMLGHVYTMPDGSNRPRKSFQPEEINRWLNNNGYAVGGLRDGLSSDHIQAHAIEFKYGHCAMDLARSVLNLYIPTDRDHNKKTACYVVVGNHCQPIIDSNVIKSIMKTANSRIGRRHHVGYNSITDTIQTESSDQAQKTSAQQVYRQRKRSRSLDRILRPQYEKSEDRLFEDQIKDQVQQQLCIDWEQEDWEEEDAAEHTDYSVPAACLDGTGAGGEGNQAPRKRIVLPLASDDTRFHYFTHNQLDLIQERCKPTYREGSDPTLIHYYVCTDKEDVEFLYQYLVRVLNIDPLRYARTFNGQCKQIRMQNTWWCANPSITQLRALHNAMHPTEPFRMSGLAGYAFRMLQQEAFKLTHRSTAIWECMSQYPPNLQRLMDTRHPFNRPKLILRNFKPPYSKPMVNLRLHQTDTVVEEESDESSTDTNNNLPPSHTDEESHPTSNIVKTLIPYSCRRRVDLIRSYGATIKNQTEEYPIHDITNTLCPYDTALHAHIPVGTYMIQIPSEDDPDVSPIQHQQWRLLTACLPPGSIRMMSHAMVKKLLERNLIAKEKHILHVCTTDPNRQNHYGPILRNALQQLILQVYTHSNLKDVCPKQLINHLVGMFNGTSVPHSGMRFVFDDVEHLYNLLGTVVGEDQWKRFRVLHNMGFDSDWQRGFNYYELDTSGMAYRSFHFQPVYNMVLEDQAMAVFDLAKPIPFDRLIQIKADAIEYEIDHVPAPQQPQWVKDLAQQTVSLDEYNNLTPEDLHDKGYMGRYKEEAPRGPTEAGMYYWKFSTNHANQPWSRLRNSRLMDRPGDEPDDDFPDLPPSNNQDFFLNWRDNHLRLIQPEVGFTDAAMATLIGDFFLDKDYSGLIVTGPAGTGKTHFIRAIQQAAHNLHRKVIKTAYTHAACVQMGFDAVTLNSLFTLNDKTDTRSILVQSRRLAAHLRHIDVDIIIIDEISMIPLGILEVMYTFHTLSPRTRFILVGDFNQLPPVEPNMKRNEDWNYFDATDIYPAIVYDRIANTQGRWLQLSECRRTTDRLLMSIVQNPKNVTTMDITQFPPAPASIPVWRFISWRNSTRKAVNFYCMHRFLQWYPQNVRVELSLRRLFAQRKFKETINKRSRTQQDTTTTNPESEDTMYTRFSEQYDKWYKPSHWKYLQNYTYAVDMEVVCRNTIKPWTPGTPSSTPANKDNNIRPECVNNRRGIIVDIDLSAETITIRWNDVIRRHQALVQRAADNTESPSDTIQIPQLEAEDVILAFHDFAFNFVPGFCITAHMAQGETIDEHFAIMEWTEMTSMPRMAYVAVTRGRSSDYLHIMDTFSEPWNVHNDTTSVDDNILKKLYHLYRWEKDQNYEMTFEDIRHRVLNTPLCERCDVPLKFTRYAYSDISQFMFLSKNSESSNDKNLQIVCKRCKSDPTHRFPPPPSANISTDQMDTAQDASTPALIPAPDTE